MNLFTPRRINGKIISHPNSFNICRSVDEIQWCYHSNDISSAERLHKTIFFQYFSGPVPFGQYYIMNEMVLIIQR